MQEFSDWLTDTWLSRLIADRIWIIAVSQTIHIIAVAVVMLAVAVLNMRILGIAGRRQSLPAMSAHFMPWIWSAMIVLLVTGILQSIAEPGREFLNVAFRIKMALILIVVTITYYYAAALRRDAHYLDPGSPRRNLAVLLASLSLALWIGIVICGRLIAYMDFRHDT